MRREVDQAASVSGASASLTICFKRKIDWLKVKVIAAPLVLFGQNSYHGGQDNTLSQKIYNTEENWKKRLQKGLWKIVTEQIKFRSSAFLGKEDHMIDLFRANIYDVENSTALKRNRQNLEISLTEFTFISTDVQVSPQSSTQRFLP